MNKFELETHDIPISWRRWFWLIGLVYGFSIAASEPIIGAVGTPPAAAQASIDLMFEPRLHQSLSTAEPAVQAYYDQGITLLAGYRWLLAERSFKQALQLDDRLAMAYLGLAKARWSLGDFDSARHNLDRAVALAVDGPAREKAWVRFGVLQFEALTSPAAERLDRTARYRAAIDQRLRIDIDDPHLLVLRGTAAEAGSWLRGQGGDVDAVAWFSSALRHDPEHWGAHHFLAHAYENLGQYQLAERHARIFAEGLPQIPHAWHMVGHLLPRRCAWSETVEILERVDRLHRQQADELGLALEQDWHFGHNLRLLAAVRLHLDDQQAAGELFAETFSLAGKGWRGGFYCTPWVEYLLSAGSSSEALQVARRCEQDTDAAGAFFGAALAGEALIALGRVQEAEDAFELATDRLVALTPTLLQHPVGLMQRAECRRSLQFLEAKLTLQRGEIDLGSQRITRLLDQLIAGRSADSWARAVLRARELESFARSSGHEDLVTTLRARRQQLTKL